MGNPLLHHDITDKIIAAYNVHNALGEGFAEKVYENALLINWKTDLALEPQKPIEVDQTKGSRLADTSWVPNGEWRCGSGTRIRVVGGEAFCARRFQTRCICWSSARCPRPFSHSHGQCPTIGSFPGRTYRRWDENAPLLSATPHARRHSSERSAARKGSRSP